MARRQSDKSRVRDSESAESLSEHDEWNRKLLAVYSCITGATAMVISNRQGKLEDAQAQLLSLLK
jgi:adenylate kinase